MFSTTGHQETNTSAPYYMIRDYWSMGCVPQWSVVNAILFVPKVLEENNNATLGQSGAHELDTINVDLLNIQWNAHFSFSYKNTSVSRIIKGSDPSAHINYNPM
jgi:hypothetical protein